MKKIIALVTGGTTNESKISIKSAATIEQNLDPDKFEVYTIMITQDSWFYHSQVFGKIEVDRNDFSLTINGIKISFEGAFISIHGSPGEDGKLQSYFEMLNIPYTSCDALTSSITMNKSYTKLIVRDIDQLYLAKSVQMFKDRNYDLEQIKKDLKLPYFVKPNNGGSSIGMSKVTNPYKLEYAISTAFDEDNQVLIEEFISGREFTVGVVKIKGKVTVLPITEVETSKDFFDFEAKYTAGIATETTPASLNEKTRERVGKIAKEIYNTLNCRGIVRIDFILTQNEGNFYFLEINTVPGQTETSFIPQQVKAAGMTLNNFYTMLIESTIG